MTPEEEQVRRALADARASRNAIPPEVAQRLDARLVELVAERSRPDARTSAAGAVSPGPARRRWPQALLAAAAVVVVVAGGGFLLRQVTSGNGLSAASGGAESHAATDGSGRVSGSAPSAPNGREGTPHAEAAPAAPGPVIHHSAVRLHTATLRHDVRGYLDHVSLLAPNTQPTRKSATRPTGSYPVAGCPSPAHGAGDRVVGAFLDGRPATMVVRPARDGTRVVQVYSCADPATPVAAAVLPARPVQPAR
ncbi:MAG: hypothetical protein ACRDPB_00305 [Nocardioidaceae bacterium]